MSSTIARLRKIKSSSGYSQQLNNIFKNQRLLELWSKKIFFTEAEIAALYASLGIDRKFTIEDALGSTSVTYTNWVHVTSFSGYSIWKYPVSNFADNSNNILWGDVLTQSIRNLMPQFYENKGAASAESGTYFDYIYYYNGLTYSSNLGDSGGDLSSDGGSYQTILSGINDYLYIGSSSPIEGATFSFKTFGVGGTLKFEYWNGSSWTEITELANALEDNTSNFTSNGNYSTNTISDDAQTTVNGASAYWIRISTTVALTSDASCYMIAPSNSVYSLLRLGGDQLRNQEFAWCYYNNYIYITFPNSGDGAYEGLTWINSNSSAANLLNFFVYQNNFTINFQDSTWPAEVANRRGTLSFNGTAGRDITHNLGHLNYQIHITPLGSTARTFSVGKAANTATVYAGAGIISNFDYRVEVF